MSADIAMELSKQTRELIARFEARADSFRGRSDLGALLVTPDKAKSEELARKLFGEGEHKAVGIDGSMDFDERLQMMLFYSNATAYSCPFSVHEHLDFDLASAHRETKLAASAAVPLWAEDMGNVFSGEPEVDIELEHSMERIPNCFMTLGELYLANLACENAKIIFLDRPLSGTFSTLSRDGRNLLKRGEARIAKWGGTRDVTQLDIYLGVHLGPPSLAVPTRRRYLPLAVPTRRRYLPLAVVAQLTRGPRSFAELARELRVSDVEVSRAVKRLEELDKKQGGSLLADSSSSGLRLADGVAEYWPRVSDLALRYSKDAFSGSKHPLQLERDQYLTILDVNTVALFMLGVLFQKARESGVLLIGMAKDTVATDITRSVLPYATESGFVEVGSPPPRLKSDRAFLAILSSENPAISTPWRTRGYDSCFSTIVRVEKGFISARKVVSREKLFARSYFQLRTLRTDPSVRSQVFLFDRLYEEAHDSSSVRRVHVEELSGPTDVSAYFEGEEGSVLSDLVAHILSLNDNPEVFEAYGHNQLLYLADKAVKAEVRMLRSSLRGVADLRVGGVSRRRKIFGLVTPYRQQRAEAEHARMGR